MQELESAVAPMVEQMCGMILQEYPLETNIEITPGFHQAQVKSIKIMVKKQIMKGFTCAIKNTAERIFHKMLKKGQLDHLPHIAQLRSADPDMRHVSPWMFITINARADVKFGSLKNKVHDYVKQAGIEVAMYNFEQRGETVDDIRGFHSHILVKQTHKYPSQFKTQLENAFKNITEIRDPKIFNFQCTDPKFLKNRINYIKGNKKDENKHPKIKIDHIFRAKNKLESYYQTNFFEARADYAAMDVEQSDDWQDDDIS